MNPLLEILGLAGNALGAAGTVLDTPGSIARGLMAGKPGRALSGIFSPDERVGGREMLEDWGALDPNEDGVDFGDVAGFGAEAVLDPLSIIAPAIGARKAFKGIRKAGDIAPAVADVADLANAIDAPLPGDISKYDMMSDEELMAGLGDFGEPMRPASEMLGSEDLLGQLDPMQQALSASMEDKFLPLETPGSLMGTRPADSPPVRIKDIFQDLWSDDAGHVGLPIPKEKPLAPTFYSRLEEAVKTLPDEIKTQSLMNTLRKAPGGFSQEEAAWRGLEDFIAKQGPKTKKSDLLAHLERTPIGVTEVDKGGAAGKKWIVEPETGEQVLVGTPFRIRKVTREVGDPPSLEELKKFDDGLKMDGGEWWIGKGKNAVVGATPEEAYAQFVKNWPNHSVSRVPSNHPIYEVLAEGEVVQEFTNPHHAQQWAGNSAKTYGSPRGTKWEQYKTPGGKDYREKLLLAPEKSNRGVRELREVINPDTGEYQWQAFVDGKPVGQKYSAGKKSYAQRELDDYFDGPSGVNQNYISPHWDEPNILAHTRYQDRIDPVTGKKALHIEEVQSDWHQRGKEEGYRDPAYFQREQEITRKHSELLDEKDRLKKMLRGTTGEERFAIQDRLMDVTNEAQRLSNQRYAIYQSVPDAPFKDVWHELAMKRMLREAAEGGYDELSWNSGDLIQALVGGEGAGQRKFYDEVLPNFMNKYTKPHGGKVSSEIVPGIAKELDEVGRERLIAEAINRDPALLERLVNNYRSPESFDTVWDTNELAAMINARGEGFGEMFPNIDFEDYGRVFNILNDIPTGPQPGMIHRLPLTDALKAQVLHKGQPLMNLAPLMAGGGGGALLAALLGGEQNG